MAAARPMRAGCRHTSALTIKCLAYLPVCASSSSCLIFVFSLRMVLVDASEMAGTPFVGLGGGTVPFG